MLGLLAGSAIAVVGTSLFGYFVHRALHEPWMGRFHVKHMTHHEVLYPADDFFSEEYRSAGKDSTFWTFALMGLPILIVPPVAAWMGLVSLTTGFILMAEVILLGVAHDVIHDKLHIKDTLLKYFPTFQKWVKLHQVHHVDMTKNFGIFSFVWDRVFKTLKQ